MHTTQGGNQRSTSSSLVLTAAKLIAPRLLPGDPEAGFQWCLDALLNHKLVQLAHDVMMAKATYFLTTAEIGQAAQVLKQFEKHGGSMRVKAATNLSFVYLLEGDVAEAQRYAQLALSHDEFHVQALVNSGNCCFELAMSHDGDRDGKLSEAWALYEAALRQEPDCVEAIYNMGLVAKAMEQYDLALEQLVMLNGLISNEVEVLYQIADLYQLRGDRKRARKLFHLTYDFVGSEPGIMARLGAICADADHRDGRDEVLQYFLQAHDHLSNIDTLAVICAQCVNTEKYETAARYFRQAALMQPADPKWLLMVASCHRRAQKFEAALEVYEQVHEQHPHNTEALKFMVQLAGDLQDESKRVAYEEALVKVEKVLSVQEDMPRLSRKQSATRAIACMSHKSRDDRLSDSGSNQVFQRRSNELLPESESAHSITDQRDMIGEVGCTGILGEDLLPGLADM
eukprot:jgi/Ulvmu1/5161/UM021_0178.1